MRRIGSLGKAREVLGEIPGVVVGVGVTAWTRSGVASLLPRYETVCFKNTQEVEALRQEFPVRVVSGKASKMSNYTWRSSAVVSRIARNTSSILADEGIGEYLKSLPKPKWLFVYKATERVERLAEELGFELIGNKARIRDPYEDKRQFRMLGKEAGLPLVEGESLKIKDLTDGRMGQYLKRWGKAVLQLTDYSRGGGVGTFFIRKRQDFEGFKGFVQRRLKVRNLEWVNVTRLVEGVGASITGCVTRQGVLSGVVQGQIVDQPELAALRGRSGVWLGHDWSGQRFSGRVQREAEELVRKLGAHMGKRGYKGIFGMDIVVDRAGRVWPIECNARYTGAFPAYTWASIRNGEIPLDVWHLLEFMGGDYEMDVERVQQMNRQPKEGGQILMHNLELTTPQVAHAGGRGSSVRVEGNPNAGIWKWKMENGKLTIEYKRPGWSLLHIKNENEFVLTDGVPRQGAALKPAERLGRLLFNRAIVDERGRLLPEVREIVGELYQGFKLKRISKVERLETN